MAAKKTRLWKSLKSQLRKECFAYDTEIEGCV